MTLRLAVLAAIAGAIILAVRVERAGRPALRAEPRWGEGAVDPAPVVTDEFLEKGERLYGWNCMPCHGAEGKGDGPVADRLALRPRNYTRGLFKLKTSEGGELPFDEDLYRTITSGIPASGMPSFRHFDPQERWALVAVVKSLAQQTREDGTIVRHFERNPARTKVRFPSRPERMDEDRGAWLFRTGVQCALCHGGKGRGDGPAAGALTDAVGRPARVPDMTRGEVTFLTGERPEDIYRVLTVGMPGSPMPSFAAIPERDRWDLASFVTSLYEPIPAGERVFLRSGCLSCHTVGRGRLIGPDLAGVLKRRTPDWLRLWLQDPPRMLLDPALKAEFKDYPTSMPNLNLGPDDIELLVQYLSSIR